MSSTLESIDWHFAQLLIAFVCDFELASFSSLCSNRYLWLTLGVYSLRFKITEFKPSVRMKFPSIDIGLSQGFLILGAIIIS